MAKGRVCVSVEGETLHGQPVPSDHRKVQVDSVNESWESLKLPVPVADLTELHEAVGSFVLWPVKLIAVPKRQVSFKKIQKLLIL